MNVTDGYSDRCYDEKRDKYDWWSDVHMYRRMQLHQRMLQYTNTALPPRLYSHAPLSERGRYVTGSRRVFPTNDSGDSSAHDDGGQIEVGAKRRRTSYDAPDTGPSESHSSK